MCQDRGENESKQAQEIKLLPLMTIFGLLEMLGKERSVSVLSSLSLSQQRKHKCKNVQRHTFEFKCFVDRMGSQTWKSGGAKLSCGRSENGTLRVAASYRMHPRENMSHLKCKHANEWTLPINPEIAKSNVTLNPCEFFTIVTVTHLSSTRVPLNNSGAI